MTRLLLTIWCVASLLLNAFLNYTYWYHPVLILVYLFILIWPFYLLIPCTYWFFLRRFIAVHRYHTAADYYRRAIDNGVIKRNEGRKLLNLVEVCLPGPARRVPMWVLWLASSYFLITNAYILFVL